MTRWHITWVEVALAATHCCLVTEEEWDEIRMDEHPSMAIEFCDIVGREVLKQLDEKTIEDMCKGYTCMM